MRSLLSAILLSGVLILSGATSPDLTIRVGAFSQIEGESPLVDGWQNLKLGKRRPTAYKLVNTEGLRVVKAVSNNSASGLVKTVDIDPEKYDTIHWKWKIGNVLENGDITKKNGDDFAARIFVLFDYDAGELALKERIKYRALRLFGYKDMPLRALNYVWANKAPAGTIVSNAYTSGVKMIAIRNKEAGLHTWYNESRNMYKDYEAAFGTKPGRITGIAIMTDSDNTRASAMAYFGDISLTSSR